jgi:succinate dehydrogenase / fumarate reductase flavoprotein subunit
MLDLVTIDGKARGIIARNLVSGKLERYGAHAVVLATGGYGNVYYLSTNAMGSNVSAAWQVHRRGAYFANPCFCQIHPTCIPVSGDYQSKLTLMSESLRNDGRVWVPKHMEDVEAIKTGKLKPENLAEDRRDYYLERIYPAFGNLVPRDVASRAAKNICDLGHGVGSSGLAVYLDFSSNMKRYGKSVATSKGKENASDAEVMAWGREVVKNKYGNLFEMYEKITGEDPYVTPMRIYPAIHYTMGGLWVDYNLETSIPGLFATGESNFSDHGANRLGASALMQGLADGYFVLPYTIGTFLAHEISTPKIDTNAPEFAAAENDVTARINKLLSIKGNRSVESFHRELGVKIMWEYCGMARNEAGLLKARDLIKKLRNEFWTNVNVPGTADEFNPELEKALRVADFLELGELMIVDALNRNESCGGHFREEYQEEGGETKRDDEKYGYVAAWEYQGMDGNPILHKEDLVYENIKIASRNYK